jgi:hypothetical protein
MLSDLSIMGSGFVDAFNSLPLMTIVMGVVEVAGTSDRR